MSETNPICPQCKEEFESFSPMEYCTLFCEILHLCKEVDQ